MTIHITRPSDRPWHALAPGPGATAAGLHPPSMIRVVLLMAAGAAPVSAIPMYVSGWVQMSVAATVLVIPLALVAVGLLVHGSPESWWAGRGAVAGLVGVSAYDAVRVPLVVVEYWPDFIPRLGGWISGTDDDDTVLGYLWRYVGDGAGIGLAFFVFCGVLLALRPSLVTSHPVLLAVGYGIVIWSGLLATVTLLPAGQSMMFTVTARGVVLTLIGHLVYGTVLGLFLRGALRSAGRPGPLPT